MKIIQKTWAKLDKPVTKTRFKTLTKNVKHLKQKMEK
jgi:hypothetical protein